jgi:5'-methylthioadenosine phosphorylase/5'-methylthioinosine phosphorylase
MDYAAISVIANWAAGKTAGEITMAEIERHLHNGMINVAKLLKAFISQSQ